MPNECQAKENPLCSIFVRPFTGDTWKDEWITTVARHVRSALTPPPFLFRSSYCAVIFSRSVSFHDISIRTRVLFSEIITKLRIKLVSALTNLVEKVLIIGTFLFSHLYWEAFLTQDNIRKLYCFSPLSFLCRDFRSQHKIGIRYLEKYTRASRC